MLAGDTATAPDEASGILGSPGTLNFGRAGNNGIHVLRMELAQDWQGLVVKAAFRTPSGCYPALMDENNEIAVPASVTAQATSALLGLISFDGTDSAGRARAGNLLYYVEDAGCPACPTPPDPDVWQMLVQMFIAAMPKQATADTLGTVKAQPVEEQGGRVPVEIMPNGKLVARTGAGSGSYNDLEDKPQINGNELIGNKTWQQLGFPDVAALAAAAAQSAQEAQAAAGTASSAASAASGYATSAQGSASTAATKASEADTSAQFAAQSASDAGQSAQQASDSADAADGSASAAAGSASSAASDANLAEAAANKIPTPAGPADAGKFVAVNADGDGYELKTGGGSGTADYNALENKPSIGGVTIEGDKTAADYGLAAKEELPKQATDTVAGIAKFQPIAEQGDNVPASILPDGTVVVPQGGESGETGEWELFQTITGDGETLIWDWDGLDFTELLVKCVGLTNISESTVSSLRILVNGTQLSDVETQKTQGASETKYQHTHLRYNGLFWEVRKTGPCLNENGYYSVFASPLSPHSVKLNHGKCTALRITAPIAQYTLKSGTVEIYAR